MHAQNTKLAERLRAVQSAFNAGDFERAFAGLAVDVEWRVGPWVFDETVLEGRDAVAKFFSGLRATAGDWQIELVDAREAGPGRVVLHQRGRFEGRTTGLSGTKDFFQLLELGGDGLVARVSEYETAGDALKAAREGLAGGRREHRRGRLARDG